MTGSYGVVQRKGDDFSEDIAPMASNGLFSLELEAAA